MELSSFEFSLHLHLAIYSKIIVIDRYGIFTAFDKDVYELGIMLNFITLMKMIFGSVPRCVIYTKLFPEFVNNLERSSGRLVVNVQHCFDVIIVEEPSTKIEKVLKFMLAEQGFVALYHNTDKYNN